MAAVAPQRIVEDLYRLLTLERVSTRMYWNKSVSFRSEFEFSQACDQQNIQTLDGGMFIFRKSPPYYTIYVTISRGNRADYSPFYDRLFQHQDISIGEDSTIPLPEPEDRRANLRHLYFGQIVGWAADPETITVKDGPEVQLDINENDCPEINPEVKRQQQNVQAQILTPAIDFFEYDGANWNPTNLDAIRGHFDQVRPAVYARKTNYLGYLNNYPADYLTDVYCSRFFFDVQLAGCSKYMSDIDRIISNGENYEVVEVKNKEPFWHPRFPNDLDHAQFGWDARRLAWYQHLRHQTGLDVRYAVAHIDDRMNRNIVAWKDITIDHWLNVAGWGAERRGVQYAPYTEFSDNFRIPQ